MIIPVYQPLGSSTHRLAQKLGERLDEPATHTGTLDPMAEGVVVCLTGDDRFNKQQHSNVKKEYQFTILVGCATDSHDLLGLPQVTGQSLDATKVNRALQSLTGEYQQTIPAFSAKRIDGQSLFDKAKQNQPTPKFKQQVTVFSLEMKGIAEISSQDLLAEIKTRVELVSGDFRQEEILAGWEKQLEGGFRFQLLDCTAITSKRTYVRGIVRDLSKKIGVPLTTFHILRSKNGSYQIKDCICLL